MSSDNYIIVPKLSYKTPFRNSPACCVSSGLSAVSNPVKEEIFNIYDSGGEGVDVCNHGCGIQELQE